MSNTNLKGRRDIFGESSFLLGRNPERPSPVHVINGFLRAAFGRKEVGQKIIAIINDRDEVLPTPPISKSISENYKSDELFRKSLSVILNPDRRAWKEIGSLFPLHGEFITNDPSDDGYGRSMWKLVAGIDTNFKNVLDGLLFSDNSPDALTSMGILLSGINTSNNHEVGSSTKIPPPWQVSRGKLSAKFANNVTTMITSSISSNIHRIRSAKIVAMTTAIYFATWLSILRSVCFSDRPINTWAELAPMFFYAGLPPGNPQDPAVRLSSRSFESIVDECRSSLINIIRKKIAKPRVPTKIPKTQRNLIKITKAFPSLNKKDIDNLNQLLKPDATNESIVETLFSEVYPIGHLEKGFRSMGRKIGLAGPERGFGSPRFMFETSMLGLLVDSTVGITEQVSYAEWLDRIYEKFGILVGFGKQTDTHELITALKMPGPTYTAVEENHDLLRRRLIRSGLASEYSDGETEIHRHDGEK